MHYILGPGHAEFFLQLAEKEGQGEPLATFVRGKGYMRFKGDERAILPQDTTAGKLDSGYGAPGTLESRYGN
jgi:hypothetical protein